MKRKMYQPKNKAWFMERLKNGERIYRDDVGKCCHHCDDVVENGLLVLDENHAGYLADTDVDFAAGGSFLNYRLEK